ncbi:hypothetical protein ACS0TY_003230 [Phlomoides rotata]
MEPTSSAGLRPPSAKIMRRSSATSIETLGNDALCLIFAFLDLVHLIRCSAVCKSWGTVIKRLKLLQIQYHKQHQTGCPAGVPDLSNYPEVLINAQMEQVAMDQQRLSLKDGPVDIFQWKAHAVGFRKCRMKMGLILTGVGDKVMRLWSAESCRGLDEYLLPDMPLIDFDFDEGKVVGLVGTRICIWKRSGTRSLFSSHQGLFTNGLCMSYVDPQAVVGCEDGKVRVFDMYSRQISQLIKMHHGAVSCLSFSDEQLIVTGSSLGSISISDLSSDQRVVTLRTANYLASIKTLCLNPRSNLLFTGSSTGHASCWDLRTLRKVWETRVSPNVIYSMHHLRNDKSTLVVGGIDGVVRIVDQDSGEVLSRWMLEQNVNTSLNRSTVNSVVFEKKKATKLSEDVRIDLMPNRPPIFCLGVGMQKLVTAHNDRFIRVWKFGSNK